MIAVNLTESQVEAIASAKHEVLVRGPNGEAIGYISLIRPDDEPLPKLTSEQLIEIKRRMGEPIENTITTDELISRLDARTKQYGE